MLEGGDPNAMLGVMKVTEANAASQQTLFIVSGSPSIQCYVEEGDPNAGGHRSSAGCCCFAANSFYCLWLPINPLLEGEQNMP